MNRSNPLPAYLRPRQEEVSPHFSYTTFSLNLATAFIAANVLDFLYIEVVRGRAAYVFADPFRVGPEKAKAFHEKNEKTFPLVHPAFYSEIRGLFVKETGRLLNDKSL
jgi:hypothetical protein